jgi:hypothetical protein
MLHMANDSGLFRTRAQLEADGWTLEGNRFRRGKDIALPLFEAKMVHHFDHRFGAYEGQTKAQANQGKLPELDDTQHADPDRLTLPRYWVPATDVADRPADRWDRGWLLGWRDVTNATNARTVIASVLPRAGVGDKFLLMLPYNAEPESVSCLLANLDSFVFDYLSRQKIGGTALKYFIMKQLPVLPPSAYEERAPWSPAERLRDWILPRVLELTYTAWDLAPFACDCGLDGPPFRWDAARRFLIRCELDAAFFHLYGIHRDDAAYILDTFPVVRKRDETDHGAYRTQRTILEIYDQMAQAIATGQPYPTRLDPPPGDPSQRHRPRSSSENAARDVTSGDCR